MEQTDKETKKDPDNMPKYCYSFPPRYRKKTIGIRLICVLITVIVIMIFCVLAYMILFWHLGLHIC